MEKKWKTTPPKQLKMPQKAPPFSHFFVTAQRAKITKQTKTFNKVETKRKTIPNNTQKYPKKTANGRNDKAPNLLGARLGAL